MLNPFNSEFIRHSLLFNFSCAKFADCNVGNGRTLRFPHIDCERCAVRCPEHAFPSSRSFFNTRLETENDSTHEGFIGREAWEIARKSQRYV